MKVKDLERLGGILPTDEVLVVTAEGVGPILVPYSAIQSGTFSENTVSLDDYDPDIHQDYEVSTIDAEPDVDALIDELALAAHPVGSYYWSNLSTDPGTLFGGTWTRITGRFLWGRENTESVGTTGGAKTVALTISNIPSHRHDASGSLNSRSHSHTFTIGSHTHTVGSHSHSVSHSHTGGVHTHAYELHGHYYYGVSLSSSEATGYGAYPGGGYGYLVSFISSGNILGEGKDNSGKILMTSINTPSYTGYASPATTSASKNSSLSLTTSMPTNYTTSTNLSTTNLSTAPMYTLAINSSGSNAAHENMPPYINAYCWRRTA